jgi:hypothetical protein
MKKTLLKPDQILVHRYFPRSSVYDVSLDIREYDSAVLLYYACQAGKGAGTNPAIVMSTDLCLKPRKDWLDKCLQHTCGLGTKKFVPELAKRYRFAFSRLSNHVNGRYYLIANELEAIAYALIKKYVPAWVLETEGDMNEFRKLESQKRISPLTRLDPKTRLDDLAASEDSERNHNILDLDDPFEWRLIGEVCLGKGMKRGPLGARIGTVPFLHLPITLEMAVGKLKLPDYLPYLEI